ncbi:MAG: tetraacyldisaccharide 4'-kinase [Candidatus Edwardsbacteria bacterium]|nr:tetraacyldisaccharide 4'-kinase [Candidatus Edwardsbacteria bacterium]MBU1577434.1 tetraacyldisaccharide 4'-kinase [Candidatus Edwardsbacteria bacterium]MBU2463232.1 tetraacyldisaccharide 4'-kinase [Candidatus Edwardsbacteria bacterium]MBU2593001.1 tetraacyldisaccharide 4'-kinase [Candidatus Edwardsbacteria bacterium]
MKKLLSDILSIIFLWPFSLLYFLVYQLRRAGYRTGLFKTHKSRLPVICVGNLTAGGTGKTPFCIMLAGELQALGFKPAILSRGYKRVGDKGSEIIAISDWQKLLAGPDESGDEPFLMAKKLLSKAIVIVGKNRNRASELAAAAGADVIIMDDGFQHWKLSRDLDIVLLDGRRPLGNGWLLPAGRLREPAPALKRAGVIIASRCGNKEDCEGIKRLKKKHHLNQPVFYCVHRAVKLRPLDHQTEKNAVKLTAGSRMLLFSGIARPDSFQNSVKALGYEISDHIIFGDHHSYNRPDLERISQAAGNCEAVVTTEKDAVKLPAGWSPGKPLLALEIDISFRPEAGKGKLLEIIKGALKR